MQLSGSFDRSSRHLYARRGGLKRPSHRCLIRQGGGVALLGLQLTPQRDRICRKTARAPPGMAAACSPAKVPVLGQMRLDDAPGQAYRRAKFPPCNRPP